MARRRTSDISTAEARRIVIRAQGLDRPRVAGDANAGHLRRTIRRLNFVQIDSVNVLARAHYMPLFSRLGPYDLETFDRDAWGGKRMFEYWAHAASLIPLEDYPLYRHRMSTRRHPGDDPVYTARWSRRDRWVETHRDVADEVLRRIREEGPVQTGDVDDQPRSGGWWEWSDAKIALESLHTMGELVVTQRRRFSRLYDVPERAIPAEVLEQPAVPGEVAERELLRRAVIQQGLGTAADLAYMIPATRAKQRLAELVETGEVVRVGVQGWDEPGYVHRGVRLPRSVEARTVLSPFDPMMWNRDRLERLWDFFYRIEIYVPEPKREYGYYVLPFLLDDALVARVDLKADRANRMLLVQASHLEPGADPVRTAGELAEEMRTVAEWLGLERIEVKPRGDLAPDLRKSLD